MKEQEAQMSTLYWLFDGALDSSDLWSSAGEHCKARGHPVLFMGSSGTHRTLLIDIRD